MPYKRFRRFRKRNVARKGKQAWYNRKYSAMDASKYALSQIWRLKGLVNSEMYKLDGSIGPSNITTSGSVTHLTPVAQGDGVGARTGNSIFVRSWNLKSLLSRTTAGDAAQYVRISVVMDTQQIGDTAPAYTDIYSASTPYSHLNPATVGRFKVLWSRCYNLDVGAVLSKSVMINLPMRHHVRYNGSASTDQQKGALYLCYVSTQGTSDYPVITGEARLSYHDN